MDGGSQLLLKQKTVWCLSLKIFLEHPIEVLQTGNWKKLHKISPWKPSLPGWLAGWLVS
jgi:hypothetical protein